MLNCACSAAQEFEWVCFPGGITCFPKGQPLSGRPSTAERPSEGHKESPCSSPPLALPIFLSPPSSFLYRTKLSVVKTEHVHCALLYCQSKPLLFPVTFNQAGATSYRHAAQRGLE